MAIFRTQKNDGETTEIGMDVINNPKLSAAAKGLYGVICHIRQFSDIENPTVADLRNYTPEGTTAISTALGELRDEGVIPPFVRRCPTPLANAPGFVYLLRLTGKSLYKIGASKKYPKRVSQIARQCPYPVELIQVVTTTDMAKTESRLHSFFAEKRRNGEWFELCDLDVSKFALTILEV